MINLSGFSYFGTFAVNRPLVHFKKKARKITSSRLQG